METARTDMDQLPKKAKKRSKYFLIFLFFWKDVPEPKLRGHLRFTISQS